jgi:hypothetical protein
MIQSAIFIALIMLATIFAIAIMITVGFWLKGWSNIAFPEVAVIIDIKLVLLLLIILVALTLYTMFSLK